MDFSSQSTGPGNRTSERLPFRRDPDMKVFEDLMAYFKEYARDRPEMVALTFFGVGFILGWRLKPW